MSLVGCKYFGIRLCAPSIVANLFRFVHKKTHACPPVHPRKRAAALQRVLFQNYAGAERRKEGAENLKAASFHTEKKAIARPHTQSNTARVVFVTLGWSGAQVEGCAHQPKAAVFPAPCHHVFFGGMKLKCSGAQHYSIPNLDDAKLRTITVFTFGAKRT